MRPIIKANVNWGGGPKESTVNRVGKQEQYKARELPPTLTFCVNSAISRPKFFAQSDNSGDNSDSFKFVPSMLSRRNGKGAERGIMRGNQGLTKKIKK